MFCLRRRACGDACLRRLYRGSEHSRCGVCKNIPDPRLHGACARRSPPAHHRRLALLLSAVMLPSLHDDFLVSYEVNCETRQIKLYTKPDPRDPAKREVRPRTIVFNGVEGYQFENDAFGNIIFSLSAIPVEQLLADHGSRIARVTSYGGCPRSVGGRSRICGASAHGNGNTSF